MLIPSTKPNKTLKGHKLLLLSPWPADTQFIAKLRAEFPDLECVVHQLGWAQRAPSADFPDEDWRDVTILLTGSALPAPEKAPKLQYVQLVSAGANHILKNPLFTDTNVAFCTANGVHGCVQLNF
jgi:hypothetical protein